MPTTTGAPDQVTRVSSEIEALVRDALRRGVPHQAVAEALLHGAQSVLKSDASFDGEAIIARGKKGTIGSFYPINPGA